MTDAKVIRAHQSKSPSSVPASAFPTEPAKPQEKQPHPEALGRSVGGHSSKIHAVCDALGLPIRFIMSEGEVHDCKMARARIDGLAAEYLLADKRYDSSSLVAAAAPTAVCNCPVAVISSIGRGFRPRGLPKYSGRSGHPHLDHAEEAGGDDEEVDDRLDKGPVLQLHWDRLGRIFRILHRAG